MAEKSEGWLRRGGEDAEKEEGGGGLFNTPRASESPSHVDHLHATDTLIVCLLTRSIQRDALRSADGVHTRLPDAPEASYCSRGPDDPSQSLSRGTREFQTGKAERDGSRNSSPFLSAEKHPKKKRPEESTASGR